MRNYFGRPLALIASLALLTASLSSGGAASAATPCGWSEKQVQARAYLAAITDPSVAYQVPVASNATRFENLLRTGISGRDIQDQFAAHKQFALVSSVSTPTFTPAVFPNAIWAHFTVYTVVPGIVAPTAERFQFNAACEIEKIDAFII